MAEGVCELSSAKLTISSESLEYAMIPAWVPWGEIWNVSTRSLNETLALFKVCGADRSWAIHDDTKVDAFFTGWGRGGCTTGHLRLFHVKSAGKISNIILPLIHIFKISVYWDYVIQIRLSKPQNSYRKLDPWKKCTTESVNLSGIHVRWCLLGSTVSTTTGFVGNS